MTKTTSSKYKEFHCELPYSFGLLYDAGLIGPHTQAIKVMQITERLIRIPYVARRREMGLTLPEILTMASPRALKMLRNKLKRKRVKK